MRKPAFCICENKDADQLCGTAQLICAFVFAYAKCRFSHDAAQIMEDGKYHNHMNILK